MLLGEKVAAWSCMQAQTQPRALQGVLYGAVASGQWEQRAIAQSFEALYYPQARG